MPSTVQPTQHSYHTSEYHLQPHHLHHQMQSPSLTSPQQRHRHLHYSQQQQQHAAYDFASLHSAGTGSNKYTTASADAITHLQYLQQAASMSTATEGVSTSLDPHPSNSVNSVGSNGGTNPSYRLFVDSVAGGAGWSMTADRTNNTRTDGGGLMRSSNGSCGGLSGSTVATPSSPLSAASLEKVQPPHVSRSGAEGVYDTVGGEVFRQQRHHQQQHGGAYHCQQQSPDIDGEQTHQRPDGSSSDNGAVGSGGHHDRDGKLDLEESSMLLQMQRPQEMIRQKGGFDTEESDREALKLEGGNFMFLCQSGVGKGGIIDQQGAGCAVGHGIESVVTTTTTTAAAAVANVEGLMEGIAAGVGCQSSGHNEILPGAKGGVSSFFSEGTPDDGRRIHQHTASISLSSDSLAAQQNRLPNEDNTKTTNGAKHIGDGRQSNQSYTNIDFDGRSQGDSTASATAHLKSSGPKSEGSAESSLGGASATPLYSTTAVVGRGSNGLLLHPNGATQPSQGGGYGLLPQGSSSPPSSASQQSLHGLDIRHLQFHQQQQRQHSSSVPPSSLGGHYGDGSVGRLSGYALLPSPQSLTMATANSSQLLNGQSQQQGAVHSNNNNNNNQQQQQQQHQQQPYYYDFATQQAAIALQRQRASYFSSQMAAASLGQQQQLQNKGGAANVANFHHAMSIGSQSSSSAAPHESGLGSNNNSGSSSGAGYQPNDNSTNAYLSSVFNQMANSSTITTNHNNSINNNNSSTVATLPSQTSPPVKRPRGRPRKHPLPTVKPDLNETKSSIAYQSNLSACPSSTPDGNFTSGIDTGSTITSSQQISTSGPSVIRATSDNNTAVNRELIGSMSSGTSAAAQTTSLSRCSNNSKRKGALPRRQDRKIAQSAHAIYCSEALKRLEDVPPRMEVLEEYTAFGGPYSNLAVALDVQKREQQISEETTEETKGGDLISAVVESIANPVHSVVLNNCFIWADLSPKVPVRDLAVSRHHVAALLNNSTVFVYRHKTHPLVTTRVNKWEHISLLDNKGVVAVRLASANLPDDWRSRYHRSQRSDILTHVKAEIAAARETASAAAAARIQSSNTSDQSIAERDTYPPHPSSSNGEEVPAASAPPFISGNPSVVVGMPPPEMSSNSLSQSQTNDGSNSVDNSMARTEGDAQNVGHIGEAQSPSATAALNSSDSPPISTAPKSSQDEFDITTDELLNLVLSHPAGALCCNTHHLDPDWLPEPFVLATLDHLGTVRTAKCFGFFNYPMVVRIIESGGDEGQLDGYQQLRQQQQQSQCSVPGEIVKGIKGGIGTSSAEEKSDIHATNTDMMSGGSDRAMTKNEPSMSGSRLYKETKCGGNEANTANGGVGGDSKGEGGGVCERQLSGVSLGGLSDLQHGSFRNAALLDRTSSVKIDRRLVQVDKIEKQPDLTIATRDPGPTGQPVKLRAQVQDLALAELTELSLYPTLPSASTPEVAMILYAVGNNEHSAYVKGRNLYIRFKNFPTGPTKLYCGPLGHCGAVLLANGTVWQWTAQERGPGSVNGRMGALIMQVGGSLTNKVVVDFMAIGAEYVAVTSDGIIHEWNCYGPYISKEHTSSSSVAFDESGDNAVDDEATSHGSNGVDEVVGEGLVSAAVPQAVARPSIPEPIEWTPDFQRKLMESRHRHRTTYAIGRFSWHPSEASTQVISSGNSNQTTDAVVSGDGALQNGAKQQTDTVEEDEATLEAARQREIALRYPSSGTSSNGKNNNGEGFVSDPIGRVILTEGITLTIRANSGRLEYAVNELSAYSTGLCSRWRNSHQNCSMNFTPAHAKHLIRQFNGLGTPLITNPVVAARAQLPADITDEILRKKLEEMALRTPPYFRVLAAPTSIVMATLRQSDLTEEARRWIVMMRVPLALAADNPRLYDSVLDGYRVERGSGEVESKMKLEKQQSSHVRGSGGDDGGDSYNEMSSDGGAAEGTSRRPPERPSSRNNGPRRGRGRVGRPRGSRAGIRAALSTRPSKEDDEFVVAERSNGQSSSMASRKRNRRHSTALAKDHYYPPLVESDESDKAWENILEMMEGSRQEGRGKRRRKRPSRYRASRDSSSDDDGAGCGGGRVRLKDEEIENGVQQRYNDGCQIGGRGNEGDEWRQNVNGDSGNGGCWAIDRAASNCRQDNGDGRVAVFQRGVRFEDNNINSNNTHHPNITQTILQGCDMVAAPYDRGDNNEDRGDRGHQVGRNNEVGVGQHPTMSELTPAPPQPLISRSNTTKEDLSFANGGNNNCDVQSSSVASTSASASVSSGGPLHEDGVSNASPGDGSRINNNLTNICFEAYE